MKTRFLFITQAAFLGITLFLANIRSFIFWTKYPETTELFSDGWYEVGLWIIALVLLFVLLQKQELTNSYLSVWRGEYLLIVFVVYSFASVFWSSAWTVTLHRSLVMALATVSAVYFGLRFSIDKFLRILFWFGGVVVLSSLLLAIFVPVLGTDPLHGFYGAWRGIFWHKNQFGNILPIFNISFICVAILLKPSPSFFERVLAFIFYFISLMQIFLSRSASGLIVALTLHAVIGGALVWLKIRHFLRPTHYSIGSLIFLVLTFVILSNLHIVFGLFNREANLTGRIPMWKILLQDVFPRNPLFGYGFGTIWSNVEFRERMQGLVGWPYPIMIGDNGFIDVLLNLGIIGLILFMSIYIKASINSARFFLEKLTIENMFPFVIVIYAFFANLTFSLFMETEVFVWMLIVVVLILTRRIRLDILNTKTEF